MISARYRTPVPIERGRTNALRLDVRSGAGAAATVTAGTLAIYDSSGAEVSSGAVTVPGGVPTYSLGASATEGRAYESRWRLAWSVTVSGTDYLIEQEAHLVRRPLRPVIDATDLQRRHSDLFAQYPAASLQTFVDEAFDEIQARMIAEGRYPETVASDWALAVPHRNLALSLVMVDLSTYTTGRGKYVEEADRYRSAYERAWGHVSWNTDRDQDGTSDDNDAAEASIMLFARPGDPGGGW